MNTFGQDRMLNVTSRVRTLFIVAGMAALLAGCAGTGKSSAPISDLSGTQAAETSSARTYTVKAGDSLNKIAKTTGVDAATISRLNNLTNPNQIRVGQVLKLSDRPADTGVKTAPVAGSKPSAKPLDAKEPDAKPTRASDAGLISWEWPAKGKVIQNFTATTKGIDIAGNAGDPIVAAADGKVMYAGNGVRGLGNLVIVNHDNGFITAYAHNRSLLVKAGQDVKKGTKIAEMGQTDTTSVRLHFEVRRQGTPVDPLSYLPSR